RLTVAARPTHAGHAPEIGDVLLVVDLVEDGLVIVADVHSDQIERVSGHVVLQARQHTMPTTDVRPSQTRRLPAMNPIELLSPAAAVPGTVVPLARRVATLEGRIVGLVDNSKAGTRPFLDRVEELLRREHGVARTVRYAKK